MKKLREIVKVIGLSSLAVVIGIVEIYLIYSLIYTPGWMAKAGVLIAKINPFGVLMAMWGIFMLGLLIWFFIYNWKNPDAYEYFVKGLVTAVEGDKIEQRNKLKELEERLGKIEKK